MALELRAIGGREGGTVALPVFALRSLLAAVKEPAPAIPAAVREVAEKFRVASVAFGNCVCEDPECDHRTDKVVAAHTLSYAVLDFLDAAGGPS